MKTLKALSLTLITLLALGIFTAEAQRGMQRGSADGGILSAEMSEALQLTDQQKLQILELRQTQQARMQSLRENFRQGDMTPNQMRAQRDELRNGNDPALQEILTEEQFAKLVELRAERRAINQANRPGRGGADGYQRGNRGNRGAGMQQGTPRGNRSPRP
ncbi:MAG: hypothetical protein HLUCCA01_11865 [Bacteroidetes bacterium HLUCCA01]|nr:MAG: hypothetical protein HLUCCA01_11865 [Bacteroidetes bacterium HLUCCA01]